MRDNDERARPRIEHVFERCQHIRVEIVRRFIEQQDVRFVKQDEQNLKPALLATRQVLHGGGKVGGAKAEALEQLTRREFIAARVVRRLEAPDHRTNPVVHDLVETLEALVEATKLDGLPRFHSTLGRLQRAVDQAQQG